MPETRVFGALVTSTDAAEDQMKGPVIFADLGDRAGLQHPFLHSGMSFASSARAW
jgi:hypothetical protein